MTEHTKSMNSSDYTQQLHQEIEQTPEEYRPLLWRLVRSFREGVTDPKHLPSAAESFRQGWADVMAGNTQPVDTLWDRIDTQ